MCHDKIFFLTLTRLVKMFGKRMKAMNLDTYLSSIVAHSCSLGFVHAYRYMTDLLSFIDISTLAGNVHHKVSEEEVTICGPQHLYQLFAVVSIREEYREVNDERFKSQHTCGRPQ